MAIYSPGSDLDETIDAILYFRDCSKTNLVRDFATFHIFFDLDHIPATVPKHESLLDKVEKSKYHWQAVISDVKYSSERQL